MDAKSAPLLDAAKVNDRTQMSDKSCVVYWVSEVSNQDKATTSNDLERRGPRRRRTRLRSGKVLDGQSELLIECQVYDRSTYGAQLRLVTLVALPKNIRLYDDEHGALLDAQVIWQRDQTAGVRFLTQIDARTKKLGRISKYGGKYYAL